MSSPHYCPISNVAVHFHHSLAMEHAHLLCDNTNDNAIVVSLQEKHVQICDHEWRAPDSIFDVPVFGYPSFARSKNAAFQ